MMYDGFYLLSDLTNYHSEKIHILHYSAEKKPACAHVQRAFAEVI